MVPPTDSQTQSPPRLEGTKPSNVDKMVIYSFYDTKIFYFYFIYNISKLIEDV